ncbi:MAG: hypothetical protein ACJ8C4_05450 [Gemmataceae bacterium]
MTSLHSCDHVCDCLCRRWIISSGCRRAYKSISKLFLELAVVFHQFRAIMFKLRGNAAADFSNFIDYGITLLLLHG